MPALFRTSTLYICGVWRSESPNFAAAHSASCRRVHGADGVIIGLNKGRHVTLEKVFPEGFDQPCSKVMYLPSKVDEWFNFAVTGMKTFIIPLSSHSFLFFIFYDDVLAFVLRGISYTIVFFYGLPENPLFWLSKNEGGI